MDKIFKNQQQQNNKQTNEQKPFESGELPKEERR